MKNEIKKGALLGYIAIFINTLIVIFFTPILIKFLGVSDYGVYTLISSVIAYFSVLDLGLGSTSIRYIAKNHKNLDKVKEINGLLIRIYSLLSLLVLILGFIVFSFSDSIFTSLTNVELQKFKISLIIMVVSLAITFPLSVSNSYIAANEKFVFQKVVSLFQNITKPLIMLPILLLGYKSVALITALSSINIAVYIINLIYAKRIGFACSFKNNFNNKVLLKEIFGFSFYVFLGMIVDIVFNNTDQIILGSFCGTTAVSIYNISMQFRSTNTNLSSVVSQLFFPKLTKMINAKVPMEEISKIFLSVSRFQLYILVLIFTGFLIFGDVFIKMWVGNEFLPAYYIVLICLLPNLVPLSQNIGIYVLQAMNMHKFRSIVFFLIAILNVLISIPLSIKYSGIGAAIGTSIAVILGQILTMNIYYYKIIKLDIKTYWKNFIKIVCPITIFSIILKLFISNLINSWVSLIIYIFIYLIIYLIYLYILMTKEERNISMAYLRKIVNGLPLLKKCLKKCRDTLYRNYITEHLIPMKNQILLDSIPDFSDNTFALYKEMINRYYNKKYKIIWMIHTDDSKNSLKEQNVYYYNPYRKNIFCLIKRNYLINSSKYIITCNGFFKRKTNKQKILYLNHGMPIKDLTKLKIDFSCVDFSIKTSDFFVDNLSTSLNIERKKFIKFGFPRNDDLFKSIDIKKILNIKSDKIILWLPTFRKLKDSERIDSKFDLPLGIPIIYDVETLSEFNKYLKENDVTIILKPHFAAAINNLNLPQLSNFILLKESDLKKNGINLYELLGNTDGLITDYSSVYFDYLLTKKPIGLTIDDIDNYEKETGFIFNYRDVIKGHYIENIKNLNSFIKSIKNNEDLFKKDRESVIIKLKLDISGNYSKKLLDWLEENFFNNK